MTDTVWAALIAAVPVLLGLMGRGGWTVYRDWRKRTRIVVSDTLAAKNEEIAALKAELRVEKANVRYLRRELSACWGRER